MFNDSFRFDKALLDYDIQGSIAYAHALKKAGVLNELEESSLLDGLNKLKEKLSDTPDFFFSEISKYEDVHEFVESFLFSTVGDVAKKLHTGRSRNDQVATDLRLYVRNGLEVVHGKVRDLQKTILHRAHREQHVVMPGFTHLQKAQAITWSHFLMSYFEMLERDATRIADCRARLNVLPLGSGALAGNNYDIDRDSIAAELGFSEVSKNSLDATCDRDFVIESLSCMSIIMSHLSRLAEDLIIYCSSEYSFISMSDQVATGSSLMPQKKNPDALELIRGKTGRVYGSLMGILTVVKGLPSSYNKDLQEDKEGLFDSFDTLFGSLTVMETVVSTLTVNEDAMRQSCKKGFLNATELADYLVARGTPFRESHHIVGQIVQAAQKAEVGIEDLLLDVMRQFSQSIDEDVYGYLSIESMINGKKTVGSTSQVQVAAAIEDRMKTFSVEQSWR